MEAAHAQASASSVTVSAVDQYGNALLGDYYTVPQAHSGLYGDQGSAVVASGLTASAFTTTVGSAYSLQVYTYGGCKFSNWTAPSASRWPSP